MLTNSTTQILPQNRVLIAVIVYIALLIDNILLTVIVPILPDYLLRIEDFSAGNLPKSVVYKNFDLHYVPTILAHDISQQNSLVSFDEMKSGGHATENAEQHLEGENGAIGILLASKALVQLIFNPIVGSFSTKFGYRLPIILGTFCLLVSSLVFTFGETYVSLLIARAVQGVGSACIGVCGMSLVAQLYPEEDRRSKVMGVILGSIALGVLLGYPFGGLLYDFVGKSAPFIILSIISFATLVFQFAVMDLSIQAETIIEPEKPKWKPLLQNHMVLAIALGIWISTSAMAILEPCLPIWLLANLHPKKWQLGTVFIPDSVGYFVGTNFFATIAYNIGQIRVSCLSLVLVGVSALLIPLASTVPQLLVPHFGLGLGIGIVDAALVPLLASFVDASLNDDESTSGDVTSTYGTVYAVQQTSVSLAYFLAPLLGGELAQSVGFPWLMRIIGIMNLLYGPVLVLIYNNRSAKSNNNDNLPLTNAGANSGTSYKRLYNTMGE